MPAEWEPQTAVQLTWPTRTSDWAPFLPRIEPVFHALVSCISQHQRVIISCGSDQDASRLRHLYQNHAQVAIFRADNNDTWARDHGPISVYRNGQLTLVDFLFNGWGGKYSHDKDNQISATLQQLGAYGDTQLHAGSWILEGGSLETDGRGTLLTTENCLLNPNRNPTLTKGMIEARLAEDLGIDRVLWLKHGHLEGDDTDAHIDTLARFCSPTSIAYCKARQSDDHYPSLHAMEQELHTLRQRNGQPYQLIPLPLPSPILSSDGERLPATYANFLIINQAVLLPIYGVAEDAIAVERIMQAFPSHWVHPINCRPVVEQYGSLHCLTMQIHRETSHV
tara:strand:+ start:4460 stop:5470 length:1011 start_codon:yes stop_codon:yes gene_type:complete